MALWPAQEGGWQGLIRPLLQRRARAWAVPVGCMCIVCMPAYCPAWTAALALLDLG